MKPYSISLFISLQLCSLIVNCQFEAKIYRDIPTALKEKDSVFILNISKQKLNEIPEEVTELTHLIKLIANKNQISKIPISIKNLEKLKHIELSKNKFNEFPVELTQLKSLKTIIMNRNHIKNIPNEIENLNQLEKMDLWSNEINYISDNISKLISLKELDLRVIMFSDKEKQRIAKLLPNCKIHFSNSCNCGY